MGLLNAFLTCVALGLGLGLGWSWRGRRERERAVESSPPSPEVVFPPAPTSEGEADTPEGPPPTRELASARAEDEELVRLRGELAIQGERTRVAWEEVRRLRQDGARQAGELRESQERTQAQVRATLRARDVAREAEETRDALGGRIGALEASERAARGEVARLESELSGARRDLDATQAELARLREERAAVAELTPQARTRTAGRSPPAPGQRALWSE